MSRYWRTRGYRSSHYPCLRQDRRPPILSEGIKGPVGAVATLERETIDDFGISEQDLSQDPTVVNAVDQIIIDAVRLGASDIHIEPFPGELKIRYRIDGVLEDQPNPPPHLQSAITSRIKIMASMNVAERRRPLDGKIGVTVQSVGNRQIDLRVSTVPTVHGESVVLRILDRQSISFGLEQLGLLEGQSRSVPPDDSETTRHYLGNGPNRQW